MNEPGNPLARRWALSAPVAKSINPVVNSLRWLGFVRGEQSMLARIGVSQQGEEQSKCNHFGIERLFLYKKKAS